ncbi:MAG: ABC transporter permease [Bacteroidota bacterium]
MAYQTPGGDLLSFHEQKMHYADTSFFKIFDFGLIKGDPRNALRGLNKVVISERAAGKYFGSDDPMGKRLTRNGKELYEVTGVFKDVPENSHIKFDLLLSYETLNKRTDNRSETHWGWYDFYTFVLLKPGTDVDQLQKKWDAFVVKTRKEAWDANSKQEFILRPLNDIHLNSHLLYESQPSEQRDGESVYALSIIAIFILVIAWVNYINLATARSFNRANEVGVRKVMGAFKAQLIGQFLTESFILNLAAAGVAILIVRAGWSPFSDLAGSKIPLAFFNQLDFWWIVMILFLIGSFLSGFYPAIILSSFKPVAVLKGKMIKSTGGTFLRQSLVIFQFAASIFLIVGSVIVYQQVNFMKGQDLGVSIDETLVLKGPGVTDSLYDQHFESFRNEVLKVPGVKSLTSSSSIPGDEIFWTDDLKRLTPGITVEPVVSHAGIDFDYVPSFGIKVIAGRNFSRDFPHDHHAILLNRAMSEILEFKDPQASIGEKVTNGRDTLEIIGVLENYHQMSLQSEVAPMVFVLSTASSFYALKIESKNYKEIIRSLNQPWESFFPGNPLDYFFLDQFYGRQYEREDRFGQVFNLFTGLAIFIAALGLFGLASFMALQRTKEIGIRKVLGSSVPEIVVLLSRSFLQPVLLANLIAWPLAWWVMDKWLTSFPYRIDIHPGVFILSGLSVGMIAFLSVSSQTLKAALIKPAETLKHE